MADENEQFKNDAAQIEAKLKEGVHRIEEVNVQPSTQAYADNRAGESARAGVLVNAHCLMIKPLFWEFAMLLCILYSEYLGGYYDDAIFNF